METIDNKNMAPTANEEVREHGLTKSEFGVIWQSIRLKATDEYTVPPEILQVNGSTIGTMGTDWVNDNLFDEGFELFQLAHVLIKDPDFVNHVKENPHYHAGCGRSNYCVGRMYSKEMKCHECVERDGEKIPNCLKREIAKLEKEAKEANERQKKC